MMVRSMRSDWLQKARLLPKGDFGLGDSGAQISVTNVATAAKFGLQRHKYDTPIRIGFAQGAEIMAGEYVYMGSVLGDVPVLEAETIFSLSCGRYVRTDTRSFWIVIRSEFGTRPRGSTCTKQRAAHRIENGSLIQQ